jgi:threonine/homoserine/homoserine lactone efflux protein
MLDSITILFLTALISFVGSIQPGPVNLSVVQATLSQNLKAGIWVAFCGSLPEIIYAFVALESYAYLKQDESIFKILEILVIPFFLIIGIYNFYRNNSKTAVLKSRNIKNEALKGFISGLLNPQLLPFWVVVLVYLNTFFKIDSFGTKLGFVLGTALGAFLILYLFAYLTNRFQAQVLGIFSRYSIDKVIGLFFILISFLQVYKIFISKS